MRCHDALLARFAAAGYPPYRPRSVEPEPKQPPVLRRIRKAHVERVILDPKPGGNLPRHRVRIHGPDVLEPVRGPEPGSDGQPLPPLPFVPPVEQPAIVHDEPRAPPPPQAE